MCRDFATRDEDQRLVPPGRLPLPRAHARPSRATLEESVELQNDCGLPTRMLSPREAQRIVPELDVDGVAAASYNPDDGVVFPWPFVWGFAQAAQKLGVEVVDVHEVVGFDTRGRAHRRACACAAADRRAPARAGAPRRSARSKVVNAAGAWSPEIARMLGVELPEQAASPRDLLDRAAQAVAQAARRRPLRRPLLLPVDARRDRRRHRQRVRRRPGSTRSSSHAFLGTYARSLVRACPVLGSVKVLRQWAGCYDLTPDANPIVGAVDDVEHFYQASGFMGHGFMMAPVVGKLIAEHHRARAHADLPDVRALEPAPLRGGQAPQRGDDHRLTADVDRPLDGAGGRG